MIRALVRLCIRRHGVVAAVSMLALGLGAWSAFRAPLDVFPEFVPAQVTIQTEAPGFAPQQVEELVTRPVENALNGASGLATLRSESVPGLSVITLTFADGVDVRAARQGVSERLSELGGTLPIGAAAPKLSPLVSSTMDLLKVGLTSERLDAFALRDVADWTLKPRLLAVPGVAHVIVFGGEVRQIRISPDMAQLASYGLTLGDIGDAARAALALRGAGFIDLASQRVLIQSPTPEPDIQAIGQAVVTVRSGVPVRIADIATVGIAPALKYGDASIMGRPGVLLSLASQYGANTLETTRAVERTLAALSPVLKAQGVTLHPALHRPASFIERALGDLQQSLLIAALLILAVLYLFLRDTRAALIAFTAIPLSLLAAVYVLVRSGQTVNTMTLGGAAVALGVLVDDAIIDIENILRRLRINAASLAPRPRLDILCEASLEIRGPVIYATLLVVAVFTPALLASSVQGHFVGPLAQAFIWAVLASLLVALTTTPALCALLLREGSPPQEAGWIRGLKGAQEHVVRAVQTHLKLVQAALALAALGAVVLLPFLGGSFMPDFREGHFVVQMSSVLPGTSLQEMADLGLRVSADVLKLPYVQSIEQQVGRAEMSEDTWGPHRSEFHVELKPDSPADEAGAQRALREIAAGYPGVQAEVVTFLGDRISESLSGEAAQMVLKLRGEDLESLDVAADRAMTVLGRISGVVDLQLKRQSGTPAITIRIDPAAMAAMGLKTQQVLDTVGAAYAGASAGQTFSGVRTVDVVLLLPESLRHRPEELGKLLIAGPFGPVPLSRIAQLQQTDGRYAVEHDGGQRCVTITFNVAGHALQGVVAEARRALGAAGSLPGGVTADFSGTADAEQQTRVELLLYSAVALTVIVMVLLTALRWQRNGWLVLANLPFSLIGSVLAVALTGIGLSLGALIGLVTVFGISARNAILLLAHYEYLVDQEAMAWSPGTLVRGAQERLVPILMTAAVTALGLLPLALGLHRPGQEIEGPMAIVVLGGLLSSTTLNLFVLPALVRPPDPTAVSRRGSRHADNGGFP